VNRCGIWYLFDPSNNEIVLPGYWRAIFNTHNHSVNYMSIFTKKNATNYASVVGQIQQACWIDYFSGSKSFGKLYVNFGEYKIQ
jgi:hypothetical protein